MQKKQTPTEIALEILDKYQDAATTVIWDHSINTAEDCKRLDKEIEAYRCKLGAPSPHLYP